MSRPETGDGGMSEFKDFLLFFFVNLVHLLYVFIGNFLDFILGFKGVVFRNIAFLLKAFYQLI